MTRTDIRDLIVKAAVNTIELTNIIDIIFKEIGDSYDKGYKQGKFNPDFDDDDDE